AAGRGPHRVRRTAPRARARPVGEHGAQRFRRSLCGAFRRTRPGAEAPSAVMHSSLSCRVLSAAALASSLAVGAGDARAQQWKEDTQGIPNETPAELQGVDIVEHLGGALPRDAAFREPDGKPVKLGDFFDGKRPTLLVFAYPSC